MLIEMNVEDVETLLALVVLSSGTTIDVKRRLRRILRNAIIERRT